MNYFPHIKITIVCTIRMYMLQVKIKFRLKFCNLGWFWGPVHTYPEIFVSANFFMRIHLASTRVRRIRSVYPEISVYALQSGNFCIRCVSGYVWTLVSVYFCIRWRHSIRTSLFPREIWLILWDVRIRIGYVRTVVYDSYMLRVDADIFVSA